MRTLPFHITGMPSITAALQRCNNSGQIGRALHTASRRSWLALHHSLHGARTSWLGQPAGRAARTFQLGKQHCSRESMQPPATTHQRPQHGSSRLRSHGTQLLTSCWPPAQHCTRPPAPRQHGCRRAAIPKQLPLSLQGWACAAQQPSLRAQHPVQGIAAWRTQHRRSSAAVATSRRQRPLPPPGPPTCCRRRQACSVRQLLLLASACDSRNQSAHRVRSMRKQRARQAGRQACLPRTRGCSQPYLLRSIALRCSSAAAPTASKHNLLLTGRGCPYLCPHCRQCSLHLLPPPHACHTHTRPARQGMRNSADATTDSSHAAGQTARKVIARGRATSPHCTDASRSGGLTSPTPRNLTQLLLHSCCSPALPQQLQSARNDARLASQRCTPARLSPTCTAQHGGARRVG